MCLIELSTVPYTRCLIKSWVVDTRTATTRRVRNFSNEWIIIPILIQKKNLRNKQAHIVWLKIPKEHRYCAFYSNPQTLMKSLMQRFNSFDYIGVSKGSTGFWENIETSFYKEPIFFLFIMIYTNTHVTQTIRYFQTKDF